MRVFVAGATGAIGHPLVSALIAAGHEPIGMTSSEHGLRALRDFGIEGVLADALDAQAVEAALRKVRPAAVIDELTSLPQHYTPDAMRATAERDRRVRLEGGGYGLNAALAAGTRRYVVQSTGFFYGPGEGLAVETDALAADATPAIASSGYARDPPFGHRLSRRRCARRPDEAMVVAITAASAFSAQLEVRNGHPSFLLCVCHERGQATALPIVTTKS